MAELGRSRVVAAEGTPSRHTSNVRGACPGTRPPRLLHGKAGLLSPPTLRPL